jgi:hypothetical protein
LLLLLSDLFKSKNALFNKGDDIFCRNPEATFTPEQGIVVLSE